MTISDRRAYALETIRRNIKEYGHHIYVVANAPIPRFAYSIGLHESLGFELVMAGSLFYMREEVLDIINGMATELKAGVVPGCCPLALGPKGSFTLREVDSSWAKMLVLGALDYYDVDAIRTLQILPDLEHRTLDVPDLRKEWNAQVEPAWQWLRQPWLFPVPRKSVAATNIGALRGERITEAARWEEDEWEICAGPATRVPKDEMRVVPLGTLIAADSTLVRATNLSIGEGIWRDDGLDWQPWT